MARACGAAAIIIGVLLLIGCRGDSPPDPSSQEERALGAAKVRQAFARHGLALRAQPISALDDGLRLYDSASAGPIFRVEIYPTVGRALESEGGAYFILRPAGYRIRGSVSSRRVANVVVVFESGRRGVRQRFRAALAELR